VNTLPVDLVKQLGMQGQLKKTDSVLKSYGGYDWKPMGIVSTTCVLRDKNYKLDFIVVPTADVPLLGIDACINLHLVQRSGQSQSVANIQVTSALRTEPTPYQDNKTPPRQQKMSNTNTTSTLSPDPLPTSRDEFVQQNNDLFNGLGKFPGEVTLRIEPTIKPRVSQPNRLAQGVVDRAKELINWMVEQQILIPYPEPESWVSKMLFPEKSDKTLRACIDPRLLNEAITTQHCEIPVVRHLIDSVVDDQYFTCLDYTQGFWHCVLDEKSSKACAVTTPFGNYRFKRLPYGIKASPEIFHAKSQEIFGNIPHVKVYIDDVLVSAPTLEQHDTALKEVLRRARINNVRFNSKKVQYRQTTVRFLGYVLTAGTKAINEDRVQAIKNLRSPKTKKQLQRIIGMFNYLREFIPQLSDLLVNLQDILKNDSKFMWLPQHEADLQEIKKRIIEANTLANFDPRKPITIQADSSKIAIGCALLQEGKPVAYASRSLRQEEQAYPTIDRESLAIYFACKKFHYYIYSRPVTIISDHLPLLLIFQKPIEKLSSTRLRQIRTKLLIYDITITYLPGKYLHIAD